MGQRYKTDEGLAREYRIDTGWIFSHIFEHWRNYDRNFLEKDFQNSILSFMIDRKLFSNIYTESQAHYFEKILSNYQSDLELSENPDHFPFPDYYLLINKPEDAYPSIISYHSSCIIEREESKFDFFFALKLTSFDLMRIDEFFKFHLNTSFKKNKRLYFDFLSKLSLKYDKLLTGKFFESIQNYMKKFAINKTNMDINKKKAEEIPKAIDLKWNGSSETEFVQFVYGLHHAGFITNAGNTITKIVTEMAEAFNYKLGKNWQSNLSDSIHDRNNDYDPKIFQKMAEGYDRYKDTLINKKKKLPQVVPK